ncbi:unnamed protein product [Sphenostylis stenocarpa]|uniref:Uncharacterized protein n=1 Tax=Sphenostylis stenocarpa TaxID=92480 RepID=A0AA86VIV8_9FABA|nr:unnamed protein product [Sphenostylis stenocarpa]
MIRSFVGKIQKGVSQIGPGKPTLNYMKENQLGTTNDMPGDVSKGYFAVIAIKDGEIKRFVVELDYLTHPEFLGLLDQAGEEYGFKQQGTLVVPCRPQELQKILDGWRMRPDSIKGAGRDIYVPKEVHEEVEEVDFVRPSMLPLTLKVITVKVKMLRTFVGKIEKGLSLFVHRRPPLRYNSEATCVVPDDVREGYFAVLATKGGECKRFVVGLHYLNDPAFLGLLDQAEEEFGFGQEGALAIPCQPQELQKILEGQRTSRSTM